MGMAISHGSIRILVWGVFSGVPFFSGCCSLHIGPSYYQNPEPTIVHHSSIPGISEASEDLGDRKPAQITATSKTAAVLGTAKN